MHHIDKFRQELFEFLPMEPPSPGSTTDFAIWLKGRGIQLFEEAFRQETKRSVPALPKDKVIEQAFPKSLNEIERIQGREGFYSSNARIFVDLCSDIASSVAAASADPRFDPFASRHHALLKGLALDALVLIDDWAALTQSVPGMYGIGKNTLHDSFQISHATDQVMFGGSPLFAFADNATDSGTALLRVALETRIRFGFGLLGVKELATGAVLPLNMSKILPAISIHESKFDLRIPLQHVERIYGWSNIYVHVGLKHYIWSPIFAHRYLNPLLRGGQHSRGSSVYAGICINSATLLAIQGEAKDSYGLNPDTHELVSIPPDKCSVVLTD